MEPASLRITLFGGFDAHLGQEPLPPFRTRKERHLLALLVLAHGRPQRRETLAQILWPFPETGQTQANYNLRRSLTDIRRALGQSASLLLTSTAGTIALELSGIFSDVIAFDRLVAKGDDVSLREAIALYRGPLLPECTDPWVLPEREARKHAYQQSLLEAALRRQARKDYPDAVHLLRQALSLDAGWEAGCCALMQVLDKAGDPNAALLVYQELVRHLQRDDPRAQPARETTQRFQEIRRRVSGRPASTTAPTGPRIRRLPAPLTRLIGRTETIEEVCVLLHRSRLTTLTGSGGVGKTRLAIAVGEAIEESFADGVCFVDLSAAVEETFVPPAIASALGIRESPGRSVYAALEDYLATRTLLLILDNCEHLIDKCAEITQNLLMSSHGLRILTTSRQSLDIPGENQFRIPSLQTEYAIQLFYERANSANSQLQINGKQNKIIEDICQRLDGIPLAIELAAARAATMPLQQIKDGLQQHFAETTGTSRTIVPRHRTLNALIQWSYDLLEPEEKRLLPRLAVFAGGWTAQAAMEVAATNNTAPEQVKAGLAALVDKSLVLFEEDRYRLLETVRQFAREKFQRSGETQAVSRRHSAYFLGLAQEAEKHLRGAEQGFWMERLESDHENLRAALNWSIGSGDEVARAQQWPLHLCATLWRFWWMHGHISEGRAWCDHALESVDTQKERNAVLATVLNGAGCLASLQGDDDRGIWYLEESLAIRRELCDRQGVSMCLNNLGIIAKSRGDFPQARMFLEESLTIQRAADNRMNIALVLQNLGIVLRFLGDLELARVYLEESLETSQEVGDRWSVATCLQHLGIVAKRRGDLVRAYTLMHQSLAIYRELDGRLGIAELLEACSTLAARAQQPEHAGRLFGAGQALRTRIGVPRPYDEREEIEADLALARQTLGERRFDEAIDQGRRLSMEEAIAEALREREDS